MAASKALISILLLSFFVLHLMNSVAAGYPNPHIDCGAACSARCRLASRNKICMRACGTCCSRCKCVPPGTSGNQQMCPCYASLTTHGGKKKCP